MLRIVDMPFALDDRLGQTGGFPKRPTIATTAVFGKRTRRVDGTEAIGNAPE